MTIAHRVVLATRNAQKLAELRRIVAAEAPDVQVLGLADVAAYLQQVAWETVQEYGAKWRVRAVLLSGAWESGIVFNVLGTPAPCTQHVAPTNVRYQ